MAINCLQESKDGIPDSDHQGSKDEEVPGSQQLDVLATDRCDEDGGDEDGAQDDPGLRHRDSLGQGFRWIERCQDRQGYPGQEGCQRYQSQIYHALSVHDYSYLNIFS